MGFITYVWIKCVTRIVQRLEEGKGKYDDYVMQEAE